MNLGRAFMAGVVGAIVMSMGLAMGRAMGMAANLEMMLGTMFLEPGSTAFMVGMVMHLMMGGLFALVYAWAFVTFTRGPSALTGAGVGFIHAIIAGIGMAMMPIMHPRIPEVLPAPGAFMSNLGMMGVMAVFVLHILYGAVVGAIYAPARVQHPAHA